jgi:hypothetical protein
MIDVACLIVIGIVVWCVANEGLWGAAHVFLCVLLSGLLAMNFFEPLAGFLDGILGGAKSYSDFVALVGLFAAFIFALRLGSEQLSPTFIQLPPTVDQAGRWVFSALTGYVTMAVLLTSLHTAPLPREFMGFKPERANFFGMAPDRQWLGFTQYITEKPMGWNMFQDRTTKEMVTNGFDGKYEVLGDPASPYPNTIWPSFPIRYASRRDLVGGSQAAAPVPVAIQPVTPAGGGGGGGGGTTNPGF